MIEIYNILKGEIYMNKSMSLKKKVLLDDGLMGVICIGIAISKMINNTNSLIENSITVVMMLAIIVSIGSVFVKSDKEDEMSKENMLKAESNTYRSIKFIMLLTYAYRTKVAQFNINLDKYIPLIYGVILLINSFSFIYYEKHGE